MIRLNDLSLQATAGLSVSCFVAMAHKYNPLINYDWSTTTAKEYKTDGVELSSGLTSFALNWTNNQDGTYTSNGISGRAFEMIEELGQTSKNYVVSFDVLSSVSGTLSLEFGSYSGTSLGLPIVKRYEIVVTEANINDALGFYSNSFIGTIGNISVQKVIQEPNKRYLKDVGSTPTYDASMYFGRGAYLNGVDQSITLTLNISNINTIAVRLKREPNKNFRLFGQNTFLVAYINFDITFTRIRFATGVEFDFPHAITAGAMVDVVIIKEADTWCLYENGVLKSTKVFTGTSNNNIDRIGLAGTNYSQGTIKDLFVFSRGLTQSEKDSYTNTPELFYAMAQADSTCVLNMPMCETDGYVRNMKSYSEGDNFSGFTIGSETMGTGNSITKNNNTFNITNVVSTGQVYLPLVKFTPDVFNSDLYYQEIEVKCVTGTLKVRAIEGNPSTTINEVLTAGQSRVYTKVSGFANLGGQKGVIFLDGLNYPSFTAEVTLRNVRKITNGIQPIQNYTTSVRDNAKNLQYGLQTCKFVRDSLGVIQSASDYLECDGVGYANTNYKFNLIDGCSLTMILDETPTNYFFGNDNSAIVNTTLALYIKLMGTVLNTYGERNGYKVFDIVYKNNIFKLYRNGILLAFTTATAVADTYTYYLGGRNHSGVVTVSKLTHRLFKVHNKELTQEEITKNYNDYVSKGLLA